MRQSSTLSVCPTSPDWGQLTRRGQATSEPWSSSSSAKSAAGWRVVSGRRAWGSATWRSESRGTVLPSPGGAGLAVGRPLGRSPHLPSGVTGLSGSGDAPGICLPSLMEPCRGSPSHEDESRTSTRRPCSRRSHLQPEGPKRRLDGHLPSGLNPGGGALRCSEPIGPKGTLMYLCPWHDGVAIRIDVGYGQLQAIM
jgi:hypothetical protein